MTHLVAASRSPWARGGEGKFSVECGIYLERLWPVYSGEAEPRRPTLPRALIVETLGRLASPPRYVDWTFTLLTLDIDEPAIASDLSIRLSRDALPWLETLVTLPSIASAILSRSSRPGFADAVGRNDADRLRYAAVVYFLAGDLERARSCTDHAFALNPNDDWMGGMSAFRDRLFRLIDEAKARGGAPPPPDLPPQA